MKKKNMFTIVLIIVLVIIFFGMILLPSRKNEKENKNALYSRRFGSTILKFEKYDNVLGQNIIVGVEKSTNRGKNYERVTKEPITVSEKAKFLFRNQSEGYVISTGYVTRQNNFKGFKVTLDGGKTFSDAKFYYENEKVDFITIEDFPFQDGDFLKMECSVYDVREDGNGYENQKIQFHSTDKGLTWYRVYEIDEQKQ